MFDFPPSTECGEYTPKVLYNIDIFINTNKRTRERPFKQCGIYAPRTWRIDATLQNERFSL